MSGFSADWLLLREPADHASRNPELLAAVGQHFSSRPSLSIVDLGSGAGSNLRGTYAALPQRQHWTLIDHDPALLAAAREQLSGWADEARSQGEELVLAKDGRMLTVDFRTADLSRDLEWILGWQPDLVAAAALLDLASRRWIERFVAALVSQQIPLYAVLTYDGRTRWKPAHPADGRVLLAFNHHQRSDKGFGVAAGPDATEIAAEAFRKSGFAVSTGESSWLLDKADGTLVDALAAGMAAAVTETGQVDADALADWLAARPGCNSAMIGHTDLWARPV